MKLLSVGTNYPEECGMTAKLNTFLIVRMLTITWAVFAVAAVLAPVAFGYPPDPC